MENISINHIIDQVKDLSYQDKLEILERINESLKLQDALVHHLTDLKGVGHEIWKGVDVAEYIDKER